jgi:hypothetical protein
MDDNTPEKTLDPIVLGQALYNLLPKGSNFSVGDDYDSISCEDGTDVPTESAIKTEMDRLDAVNVAQEYVRNRQTDYPDTGAQFNKIYDDGLTKWKSEMVDPVKAKWPKDNSGPVE